MRLDEYQWSHNPRGMHNTGAPANIINVDQLVLAKMGWAKVVTIEREAMPPIEAMVRNGITPIIRIFRPRFGASAPTPDLYFAWSEYYKAGVRWFELYNEPNFEIEWPESIIPSYSDTTNVIGPLVQNWLDWAEKIIEMGGYPAFPALGEKTGAGGDMNLFLTSLMNYISDNFYDRFRNVADNGMWLATHPYFYNHFYQEGSGPISPRPFDQERADQAGWHFEYPFDPLTQANKPGLTAISGPPDFPNGDPLGLTGMGHAFMKKFGDMFGGGAIPVVGTEGGITPAPTPGITEVKDARFPGFDWNSHAESTLATFNWIAEQGPPWMFGLTLWKQDEYFEGPHGILPATQKLANTAPVYKTIPAIEALDGPGPGPGGRGRIVVLPGPGPIHGTPDYHFLILAPTFNTNWFFSEAHDYWSQFRPTVISSTDYIAYIPPTKSVATTVLTTPDLVDYMTHHIQERWPNVYFDLIVANDVGTIADILSQRTQSGRRFG